jgi:hypothetical protein
MDAGPIPRGHRFGLGGRQLTLLRFHPSPYFTPAGQRSSLTFDDKRITSFSPEIVPCHPDDDKDFL